MRNENDLNEKSLWAQNELAVFSKQQAIKPNIEYCI